ncbi:2-oxoglutarate dehydrogenase E1 component [Penicillium rubens]|uniref:Dehydrogenase E1 component n=1 Tax=Penicillium chrysogenum TaxID=5076 RepID=A0ABQ8WHB7_PENCH|nr:2-oxoglutarate dehydrogenase E1 component [Penicillium rubens]KAJ5265014.1 Dehydrogenase E1 component [Penicillium chrysogenum]
MCFAIHKCKTESRRAPAKECTANYIDEMYMAWKNDASSVHISWQTYFKNMEEGKMPISQAFTPPPTLVPKNQHGQFSGWENEDD